MVHQGEVLISSTPSVAVVGIAYVSNSFGYSGTITAGDVLEIDSEAMTVKLNGANMRSLKTGKFPKLYSGTNEVRWQCDEVPSISFKIDHTQRYE